VYLQHRHTDTKLVVISMYIYIMIAIYVLLEVIVGERATWRMDRIVLLY